MTSAGFWWAMMLSPSVDVLERLLRGEAATDELDQVWLAKATVLQTVTLNEPGIEALEGWLAA